MGKVGQKDKLSYISWIRQVETGLERRYSEKEAVKAAIRSHFLVLDACSYKNLSNRKVP